MSYITTFLCVLCVSAVNFASIDEIAIEQREVALANGVKIIAAHVPDATHQSFFVFQPLHLANDAPDRAQWSHLIEHHLVRSTDPESIFASDVMVNGETTDSAMRLDATLVADRWREGVARVKTWLNDSDFNADLHERELAAIAGEESFVAPRGYTHKFSLAAWNQIVRHGKAHAAVHGDVQQSTLGDAQAYARQYLPRDGRTIIATVGPVELDAVIDALTEALGELPPRSSNAAATTRPADEINAAHAGTWDLPVRHAMRWWKLPDDDERSRAIAIVAAWIIQMNAQAAAFGDIRQALAHPVVTTPEGRYLIVNASLTDNGDAAKVLDAAMDAVRQLAGDASRRVMLRMQGDQFAKMMSESPDFATIREQMPEQHRRMIEAQWLLTRVNWAITAGLPTNVLVMHLRGIDDETAERFFQSLLESPGGTLVLEPRTD